MKIHSFKVQLALAISVAAILVFGALITYSTVISYSKAIDTAEGLLSQKAKTLSVELTSIIDNSFTLLQTQNRDFIALEEKQVLSKDLTTDLIRSNLQSNKNFTGMCAIFESNTLCRTGTNYPDLMDKGNFIPYVYYKEDMSTDYTSLVDYDVAGDGDYYLIPKRDQKQLLTEPYFYPVNGEDVFMITLVDPILYQNLFAGVATIDYDVQFVQLLAEKIMGEIHDGHVEVSVISHEGVFVANSKNRELIGKAIHKHLDHAETQLKNIKAGREYTWHDDHRVHVEIPITFAKTENPWQVHFSVSKDVILADVNQQKWIMILFCGVLTLILIVLSNFLIVRFSRPLDDLVQKTKQVSEGDLNVQVNTHQKGEFGLLANSFQQMISTIREVVESIDEAADSIATASQEIHSNGRTLSTSATTQAASAEEISSSMEEMGSNIAQNRDNAKQTEKIADAAADAILNVSNASKRSLEAVSNISDKINIINDIAFQTNILALNAAVEAARAGEHGRGFAVVAAEVRKLAERSKKAADEIVLLSATSRQTTVQVAELMDNLTPEIQETSSLVREIAAASSEQSNGAAQVNSAITQMNELTQHTASAAEELAASSDELSKQASLLQEKVAYFRIKEKKIEKKEVLTDGINSIKKHNTPFERRDQAPLRSTTEFDKNILDMDVSNYETY